MDNFDNIKKENEELKEKILLLEKLLSNLVLITKEP